MAKRTVKAKTVKKIQAIKEPKTQDSPFDLIKAFFTSDYKNYTRLQKQRLCFIINRFMSIEYPLHAALLSRVGTVEHNIMDYWKFLLSKNYSTSPNWLYTKTKKTEVEKTKIYKPSKEAVDFYLKINDCSYKEYDEALSKFGDKVLEELKEIEAYIK